MRYELDWALPDDEIIEQTITILGSIGIVVHKTLIDMDRCAYIVELDDPPKQFFEIHQILESRLSGHPAFPDTIGLVLEPSQFADEIGADYCITIYNCYLI